MPIVWLGVWIPRRSRSPYARCTVERLMRANGWQGVTRRKKVRTTLADPAAARAADLVKRQFRVPAPNVLVVAASHRSNTRPSTTLQTQPNPRLRTHKPACTKPGAIH